MTVNVSTTLSAQQVRKIFNQAVIVFSSLHVYLKANKEEGQRQ